MKKNKIALLIYGQIIAMASPGFMGIAQAATTTNSFQNQNNEQNHSAEVVLANVLSTTANNPNGAAASLASTYGSEGLNNLLNRYGHASASFSLNNKGKLDSAAINFLKPILNTKKNTFFYQLSYHKPEHRNVFSVGLGDRHFFDNGQAMVGVNSFVDADTRGNVRGSVGFELGTNDARLSTNYYQPLSSWRKSNLMSYYDTRPARGFDIRFKGYLPQYPALSTNLSYSKYFGNVDVLNNETLTENPSLFTYGVSYRPMQLLSFTANRQQVMGGEKQWTAGMTLHYQLDVPLKDQLKPVPTDYGSVQEMRYAFVQRNYTMPLNYKDVAVLTVGLKGGELQDGSVIYPTIVSQRDIKQITWSGSLAKYLSDTHVKNPTVKNLPDGKMSGTLTITIENSAGTSVSASAVFNSNVGTTLTAGQATAAPNTDDNPVVKITHATPGAKVTATTKSGQVIGTAIVNSDGTATITGTTPIADGIITVTPSLDGTNGKPSQANYTNTGATSTAGQATATPNTNGDPVVKVTHATPGAKVTATTKSGQVIGSATVSPDGTATITGTKPIANTTITVMPSINGTNGKSSSAQYTNIMTVVHNVVTNNLNGEPTKFEFVLKGIPNYTYTITSPSGEPKTFTTGANGEATVVYGFTNIENGSQTQKIYIKGINGPKEYSVTLNGLFSYSTFTDASLYLPWTKQTIDIKAKRTGNNITIPTSPYYTVIGNGTPKPKVEMNGKGLEVNPSFLAFNLSGYYGIGTANHSAVLIAN